VKTTENSLKILEFLGDDVPVAMGMRRPIMNDVKTIDSVRVHGIDGLGGADLPEPGLKPVSEHAIDFIIDLVDSSKRELTLISTGPMTNIAMAILKEPEIMSRVKNLVSMGGAFGVTPYGFGNVTPVAEFNVYTDPMAAEIVYRSGMKIIAVGLDVTMNPQACVDEMLYDEITSIDTSTAKLFKMMFGHLIESHKLIPLHDPMAVSCVIDPSLVKTERYPVAVELYGRLTRGQTIADRRNSHGADVNVCVDVDGHRFLNMIVDRVMHD
jgi:purine nucleosidase